jgi:hypothetical protein
MALTAPGGKIAMLRDVMRSTGWPVIRKERRNGRNSSSFCALLPSGTRCAMKRREEKRERAILLDRMSWDRISVKNVK